VSLGQVVTSFQPVSRHITTIRRRVDSVVTRQIRPYEPDDREAFLSLYADVWGHEKGEDWFAWRFEANPYRDGVQMVVAEDDGALVGAEPLLPFRLRIGSLTVDAYQPVDWIVHPDHRREGVFTRMTERLLDQYADDGTLLFNFPTDALVPGLEKFGWEVVGPVSTNYRIQHPEHALTDTINVGKHTITNPVPSLAGSVARGGLDLLERIGTPDGSVAVERHDDVPVATLATLYESAPPGRIHVARDEAFLSWRFANPRWETATYVASRDGSPVASVVTATERVDGLTTTSLLDHQPMARDGGDRRAYEALLSRVVRDHRDDDLLKTLASFDSRLLRRHGFLRDTAFPLSRRSTVSVEAVRPATPSTEGSGDPWRPDGVDLTDAENWCLTLADLDVA
jgi:GNAT superfamily N-acetyltransferase